MREREREREREHFKRLWFSLWLVVKVATLSEYTIFSMQKRIASTLLVLQLIPQLHQLNLQVASLQLPFSLALIKSFNTFFFPHRTLPSCWSSSWVRGGPYLLMNKSCRTYYQHHRSHYKYVPSIFSIFLWSLRVQRMVDLEISTDCDFTSV